MEGLLPHSGFSSFVAESGGLDRFTLFDVGCSGGFDPCFRAFGERLSAFGFDPDIEECARLESAETLPGVSYINAFVGPPPDHPFLKRRREDPVKTRHVWFRLSGPQTEALRAQLLKDPTVTERRELNLWRAGRQADPAKPLSLPAFARERKILDVDFIKIDVDGEDFAILNDIAASLAEWGVLGLGLEVSFDGSEGETENSFHNTDRLMRACGFDLVGLTLRRYSLAALPGIFEFDSPAQTRTGRVQLGDAIYLRDLADPRHAALAASLEPGKLLKLAALASLASAPDLAADVLLASRERLEPLFDVAQGLDLLAAETQADGLSRLNYAEYMSAYHEDLPLLYAPRRAVPAPPPAPEPEAPAPSADAETLRHLREEIAAMRRSASWRVTRPLRAVQRLFRRSRWRARRSGGAALRPN